MTFQRKNLEFIKSASGLDGCPGSLVPEVALAGRSNAGKSSLINALSKNQKIAKVSSSPGKTDLLNFYKVESLFRLVDMPGYGYAKRSKGTRDVWQSMVESFLSSRGLLCGVVLIMDGRRSWSVDEGQLFAWLDSLSLPKAVAITKIDKMNQKERSRQYRSIQDGAQCPVFPVSNVTGQGFQNLYSFLIEEWVLPKKEELKIRAVAEEV